MTDIIASLTWRLPAAAYSALSSCKINGREVPCDQLWDQFGGFFGFGAGLFVALMVINILAFVFWILMLIDAIRRPIANKVVWILVLVFTGIIGALIYYFVIRRGAPKLGSVKTV